MGGVSPGRSGGQKRGRARRENLDPVDRGLAGAAGGDGDRSGWLGAAKTFGGADSKVPMAGRTTIGDTTGAEHSTGDGAPDGFSVVVDYASCHRLFCRSSERAPGRTKGAAIGGRSKAKEAAKTGGAEANAEQRSGECKMAKSGTSRHEAQDFLDASGTSPAGSAAGAAIATTATKATRGWVLRAELTPRVPEPEYICYDRLPTVASVLWPIN